MKKLRNPAIPVSPEVLNELKAQAKTRRYMKPYLEHLFVPTSSTMKASTSIQMKVRPRCRKVKRSKR